MAGLKKYSGMVEFALPGSTISKRQPASCKHFRFQVTDLKCKGGRGLSATWDVCQLLSICLLLIRCVDKPVLSCMNLICNLFLSQLLKSQTPIVMVSTRVKKQVIALFAQLF